MTSRPIHLIGLRTETYSSFLRGAAAAPAAIRAALASDHWNPSTEIGLEFGSEIAVLAAKMVKEVAALAIRDDGADRR